MISRQKNYQTCYFFIRLLTLCLSSNAPNTVPLEPLNMLQPLVERESVHVRIDVINDFCFWTCCWNKWNVQPLRLMICQTDIILASVTGRASATRVNSDSFTISHWLLIFFLQHKIEAFCGNEFSVSFTFWILEAAFDTLNALFKPFAQPS